MTPLHPLGIICHIFLLLSAFLLGFPMGCLLDLIFLSPMSYRVLWFAREVPICIPSSGYDFPFSGFLWAPLWIFSLGHHSPSCCCLCTSCFHSRLRLHVWTLSLVFSCGHRCHTNPLLLWFPMGFLFGSSMELLFGQLVSVTVAAAPSLFSCALQNL